MDDTYEDLEVELTLRYSADPESFDTKIVNYGLVPMVHITPEELENGSMRISIDSTDFGTPEDLAEFLEEVVSLIREVGNPEISS